MFGVFLGRRLRHGHVSSTGDDHLPSADGVADQRVGGDEVLKALVFKDPAEEEHAQHAVVRAGETGLVRDLAIAPRDRVNTGKDPVRTETEAGLRVALKPLSVHDHRVGGADKGVDDRAGDGLTVPVAGMGVHIVQGHHEGTGAEDRL